MPAQKLPETLTQDELEALKKRPNVNCPTGLRNRVILELMHRGGLRVSEACKLHLRDVDWRSGEIRLRAEVAKGGREAVIPIDPVLLSWLERWKHERRRYAAGQPWLFCTLKGGRLNRHYVWEMVARYARKAGIDRPVYPHMLRHTFATELLNEGFNLREVQDMLRHADVRTTQIYTHISKKELAAKIRGRAA